MEAKYSILIYVLFSFLVFVKKNASFYIYQLIKSNI